MRPTSVFQEAVSSLKAAKSLAPDQIRIKLQITE